MSLGYCSCHGQLAGGVYVYVKCVPCLCVGVGRLWRQRGVTANNRQGCWRHRDTVTDWPWHKVWTNSALSTHCKSLPVPHCVASTFVLFIFTTMLFTRPLYFLDNGKSYDFIKLKRQFAPKSKYIFFLSCSHIYPLRLFWCEFPWVFKRLPQTDCNGTRWHSACGAQRAEKITFEKLSDKVSFQKSWLGYPRLSTDLVVRGFKEGTIFYLIHHTERSLHLLVSLLVKPLALRTDMKGN